MSSFFANSSRKQCSECGASVDSAERKDHVCDPEQVLDYQMLQAKDEIASFDELVGAYLRSSAGQFAQWLAERERPAW
jgi:hypothetical protein